jgi:hypothetical protein
MHARTSSPARLRLAVGALCAAIVFAPALAVAQQAPQVPSECQQGIALFKARISIIERIQKMPKKHADPNVACSLFTSLGGANARVLSWAKKNKDWCSIQDNQITGLEAEAGNISKIRGQACTVAAQYKKLKAQAEARAKSGGNGGFAVDMSQDPLAPRVKIPPSAL